MEMRQEALLREFRHRLCTTGHRRGFGLPRAGNRSLQQSERCAVTSHQLQEPAWGKTRRVSTEERRPERCTRILRGHIAGTLPLPPLECEGIMNTPRRSHFTLAFLLPVARIRLWASGIGDVMRAGLTVLLVCVVLAPAARAFEWCPNALGPDAWCPDGWACCPYPYGPGYWC